MITLISIIKILINWWKLMYSHWTMFTYRIGRGPYRPLNMFTYSEQQIIFYSYQHIILNQHRIGTFKKSNFWKKNCKAYAMVATVFIMWLHLFNYMALTCQTTERLSSKTINSHEIQVADWALIFRTKIQSSGSIVLHSGSKYMYNFQCNNLIVKYKRLDKICGAADWKRCVWFVTCV